MRFISVPNRAKYVVRPTTRTTDALGMPQINKGLSARFINHAFDSEKSQRQQGWTDEERVYVERYLLQHPDLDRHNGFYLDDDDADQIKRRIDLPAASRTTRCIAFFRNEDKELEQCPKEALDGQDYCSAHLPEVAEAAHSGAEA